MNTLSEKLPKWNLTSLYQNREDPAIVSDIETVRQAINQFVSVHKGNIRRYTGAQLGKAIKEYEIISDRMGRLESYAYLQYSENMSHQKATLLYQNISEKMNELSAQLLFFQLELNHLSEADLRKKFSSSTSLRYYAPWIRDIQAYKPYQLDEKLEQLFHERYVTARQSWHRLFDETLADMRFPYGKAKLTNAEIFDLLSHSKSATRKKAAKSIGHTLGAHSKIFTTITNVLAKDKAIEDTWRGFAHPISSRNVSNLVEDHVTEALVRTVKSNYAGLSHRYYTLKAKWFGKHTLNYWDRNAPLPGHQETLIPFREAKQLVLKAYFEFSPSMERIAKQFFTKRWIDAAPRAGKDSGAFSHPTVPSAHPYILMNYQGKIRDVMTLAHELGHGIHQVLAAKQGALMADTPLTLAETASVFGEQLAFRALLARTTHPLERKIMLAHKVEDMLNTVVRQIAFCEFERLVHEKRKEGELSTEEISAIWMHVQRESLGPAIHFEEEYQYYWMYIPHLIHTPFYVYAYAFGDCLVNTLYQVYTQHPEGFESKYLNMLQAGGTLRHKELLAPFGLDASSPQFWQLGLDVIRGFIDELEQMKK